MSTLPANEPHVKGPLYGAMPLGLIRSQKVPSKTKVLYSLLAFYGLNTEGILYGYESAARFAELEQLTILEARRALRCLENEGWIIRDDGRIILTEIPNRTEFPKGTRACDHFGRVPLLLLRVAQSNPKVRKQIRTVVVFAMLSYLAWRDPILRYSREDLADLVGVNPWALNLHLSRLKRSPFLRVHPAPRGMTKPVEIILPDREKEEEEYAEMVWKFERESRQNYRDDKRDLKRLHRTLDNLSVVFPPAKLIEETKKHPWKEQKSTTGEQETTDPI